MSIFSRKTVTEPDFGSDVAGLKVSATPVEDGWLLNGQKTWCTFAGKADVLMVLARSDADASKGHRGLTIFLAEKPRFDGHEFGFIQPPNEHDTHSGGKITARAIDTIGYRGMHSFDVFFEDFFVPEHNVLGGLGGIGKGFYYQMEGFAGGRLQTAARATGGRTSGSTGRRRSVHRHITRISACVSPCGVAMTGVNATFSCSRYR